MIEFKSVTIKYVSDVTTLLNADFSFRGNTLILGDEFLGATSILRLIAKLDKPTSGDILIDGDNLKDIKDKDSNIAYIPKNPYLFEHKSVEKNLSYPLKIRKFDKNLIKNEVNRAISLLNSLVSKNNLKIFPNTPKKMNLSEKKILTLLRALIRRPKYILIEDFFTNLDAKFAPLATSLIEEMKNQNITIIATSSSTIPTAYKDFEVINLED